MNKMIIGIASQQAIRTRALAIASGDHQPGAGEPKIWFTSIYSLAEVLSDDNREREASSLPVGDKVSTAK